MPHNKVQVHVPYSMLLERSDEIIARGLNPEIYCDGDSLDNISLTEARLIAVRLKEGGLRVTMHGPFMDINPGATDERIREATEERFLQFFQVADQFSPTVIVLHGGYDRWRYDDDEDLWLQQSLKTWPRFAVMAEEMGADLAIENVFDDKPATLGILVNEIGSSSFGICFDPGHWNLFSTLPMSEWFKEIGRFMKEVHLHDNTGAGDDHLALGEGSIDYSSFFRMFFDLDDKPVMTIEAHSEKTLNTALANLDRFLKKQGLNADPNGRISV